MGMVEFKGYRVDPERGIVYGKSGRPLRAKTGSGYISVGRGSAHMYAHRMVWECVYGPVDDGLYINHINGDKADNRIANLEVVTSKGNQLHAARTGLLGHVRLTPEDVKAIRADTTSTITELAERYGVGRMTICDARRVLTWGWVGK